MTYVNYTYIHTSDNWYYRNKMNVLKLRCSAFNAKATENLWFYKSHHINPESKSMVAGIFSVHRSLRQPVNSTGCQLSQEQSGLYDLVSAEAFWLRILVSVGELTLHLRLRQLLARFSLSGALRCLWRFLCLNSGPHASVRELCCRDYPDPLSEFVYTLTSRSLIDAGIQPVFNLIKTQCLHRL